MVRITQWDRHIGWRLQLRDLFVFFSVVECGSMAKAALQLGVSTPSISDVIAHLEHALGVRCSTAVQKGLLPLLMAKPFWHGVEPPSTSYIREFAI